ncbi:MULTISPECIES: hypothetical protein [unclassified Duganella]|uniref:hypothetical protein n=1 Tax=unclassified Duganella TaxID=2636909 RepID=UPI0008736B6D|nr:MULTISPECIES: hypothetical protein [unclassified Duganella]OEZ61346.1 hypothetical protein DUGA6_23720 [Duganella sp. HH105]OFA05634.1 hypothetical protein DUGA2_12130 [Duganella sp. HH101]
MKYLGLIALLVLSACGGSTSYEDHTPVTPPPPPPVVMLDAFYTAVMAFIGDGSESSAEPAGTDTVVATAPEDTEPVAYK